MSCDPAIRGQRLTKSYQIYSRPVDRLKQMIGRGRRHYYREFIAVRSVDLEVRRGETFGIVGRNGSGKSTLLKMICGTIPVTSGELEVRGRIAPLLTIGAGFNPEFTGRENVYLNAAILGLSQQQIDERYDDIVAFADIGRFINDPVKIYSSGMYSRLAFAVAIHVDPDILVVDEILSVGDDAFRRKCTSRIEEIKSRGATILFVSHAAQSVIELCDRALLMDEGRRMLVADPKTVTTQYHRLLYARPQDREQIAESILRIDSGTVASAPSAPATVSSSETAGPGRPPSDASDSDAGRWAMGLKPPDPVEYPQRGARIHHLELRLASGRRVNVIRRGGRFVYTYLVTFERAAHVLRFGMMIRTANGFELAGLTHHVQNDGTWFEAGQTVRVSFTLNLSLAPRTYFLNAGVYGTVNGEPGYLHRIIDGAVLKVAPVAARYATGHFDIAANPEQPAVVEVVPMPLAEADVIPFDTASH